MAGRIESSGIPFSNKNSVFLVLSLSGTATDVSVGYTFIALICEGADHVAGLVE